MKLIVGIDAAVVVSPCTLSLCSGALLRIRTPSHSLSVGGWWWATETETEQGKAHCCPLSLVRSWSVLSALSRLELIGYSHSSVLLLSVVVLHHCYSGSAQCMVYGFFGCVHPPLIRGTSPCRLSPYTLSFMPGFLFSLIRLS